MSDDTKTRQMTFSILDDGSIRADFGPGLDPLTFNPSTQLAEALYPQAIAGGVVNRVRSYTSRLAGDARTPAALREAVAKGFADLMAGVWERVREGAGEEISIEAEAAHVFRQKRDPSYAGTLEDSAAAFSALTDDQKKKLKALPRYQAAYADIKAKRAAEKAAKMAKKAEASEDSGDLGF